MAVSPDRASKFLNERTTNWIVTSGSGQKISGNSSYQSWSTGMNGFDAGSNLTAIPTTSKLDPNSKPFAPRQPIITNGHAGQMQIRGKCWHWYDATSEYRAEFYFFKIIENLHSYILCFCWLI